MSRTTVTILLALLSLAGFEAKAYKPAGNRIMTTWGENIDPSKVWQEYPRPIMERPDWENLNGLWQYAILEKDVPSPAEYQGDILVPFCAESALSGVGKEVGEKKVIWYKRMFTVPKSWRGRALAGETITINMPADVKLWSPDSPYLYDLEVSISSGGKTVDKVKSYAAMRKISTKKDGNGVVRLQLNNKDLFQYGPLDQGWWPDGLYTAPSYEAMVYDVDKTKEWGFNMIRKHVKIEPALWYTYCDRNGIIVWQDMPSSGSNPTWQPRNYFHGEELQRSPESEANYRKELKEVIDALRNYPCIVVWTPFNEGFGQFKTPEIVEWIKTYDPSRLVNPASGGNFYPCGDIIDMHTYPSPPQICVYDGSRANVIGEYGGIGMATEGHLWAADRNWGYVQNKSADEVTKTYEEYADKINRLADYWIVGAVYTQTTDVESEINGLMTYDRKVVKIDKDCVREANRRVIANHSK